METLYGFCRVADDIVDEKERTTEEKQADIDLWRKELDLCYTDTPETPLAKELASTIREFLIPPEPLGEILSGVEMDLTKSRYETFEELELYCYRVASAVGLASINIFGYSSPQTKEYAVALGMAFQLTNILRDVRYDLEEYDRIYLPQEELKKFGVTEEDFLKDHCTDNCRKLFRMQWFRAEHYFHKAARLLPAADKKNLIAAELMTEVYYGLLQKIRKHDFDVISKSRRLSKIEKALLIAKGRKGACINKPNLAPPQNIAVWGAGLAGIGAALELGQQGHTINVYEAKSYLGGRAHSFTDARSGITLDNGQHIFMGCYHHSLGMLEKLGVLDKLHCQEAITVPYTSIEKGQTVLKASKLPAPLHLLSALLGFKELSFFDRLGMMWMGVLLRLCPPPQDEIRVEKWMTSNRQTQNSIRALWEPLCIAALNEPIQTASARLFYNVLQQSLFGGRKDSSIYVSNVGLSELLEPEAHYYLQSIGGDIHLGNGIKTVTANSHTISAEAGKSGSIKADLHVSAVPWNALSSLLPEDNSLGSKSGDIPSAPIISLHLLTDKEISQELFIGVLDSPVQWVFNRTHILKGSEHEGKHLSSVVISAAYELLNKPGKEVLDVVWSEIQKHFPNTADAQVLHHVIYKCRDATFAARPETEPLRPGNTTQWDNLFLVGDWIQTGLPATLESAVQSVDGLSQKIDQRLYSTRKG